MQILHTPTVKLIAITQFTKPPDVNWNTDTAVPSQQLIEFAGRMCYQSWANPSGRGNAEYITNLLARGHLSVLEHASASFMIAGVSRSLTHELVRHRHLSFSQLSQRFVAEDNAAMVEPEAIASDPEAHAVFEETTRRCLEAYSKLCELMRKRYANVKDPTMRRKLARQAARSVLPNATETQIVVTGNFRAWRHFIRMRASEAADVEIRAVALEILRILQKEAPAVFGDFRIQTTELGIEVAETEYCWE
ncbi:MAG: FAD-dependent thymidylate synthase [Armatimonadota bacterium]